MAERQHITTDIINVEDNNTHYLRVDNVKQTVQKMHKFMSPATNISNGRGDIPMSPLQHSVRTIGRPRKDKEKTILTKKKQLTNESLCDRETERC